jgi:hypothetical protein
MLKRDVCAYGESYLRNFSVVEDYRK